MPGKVSWTKGDIQGDKSRTAPGRSKGLGDNKEGDKGRVCVCVWGGELVIRSVLVVPRRNTSKDRASLPLTLIGKTAPPRMAHYANELQRLT